MTDAHTYYLGIFMLIAGTVFIIPFAAMVIAETCWALSGKTSIFNRYLPPPKPLPRDEYGNYR